MTTESLKSQDCLQMVDRENGTVDRRMFSDKEIYEAELEHIFARAWNFMAHESQVPNPGDFFQTYIGEDRVIVIRDKSGAVSSIPAATAATPSVAPRKATRRRSCAPITAGPTTLRAPSAASPASRTTT